MHFNIINFSRCFYCQALRLSQKSLIETSPGKIVNLLSNDVSRFEIISLLVHPLWASPLLTISAAYILWQETQWAGMIGLAVILLIVPIQSKCYSHPLTLQLKMMDFIVFPPFQAILENYRRYFVFKQHFVPTSAYDSWMKLYPVFK